MKMLLSMVSALSSVAATELIWTDAESLGVRGRANFTESGPRASYYDRFPAEAQGIVRDAVWGLSRNSAGMYVQFKTCSDQLSVNVSYTSRSMAMWHFPATGVAGLDLYAFDDKTKSWRWTSTTSTIRYPTSVNTMSALSGGKTQRYRLHLPTYNGVTSLSIGHTEECPLADDDEDYRQIVWYGTSITQGGVASRPGMAFTNWISREIGYEILNFGFSGNGLMEQSVAKYLVQIEDPALFVIDCSWNMKASLISSNAVPLVNSLRERHPDVPIVMAEDSLAGAAWVESNTAATAQDKRDALRGAYDSLVAAGQKDIYYVEREKLYSFSAPEDKFISPTVGGTHPTDLGMKKITDFYKEFLPTILTKRASAGSPQRKALEITAKQRALEEAAAETGYDPALETTSGEESAADVKWVDVATLGVMGRAFKDTPTIYNRLPTRAQGIVHDDVWSQGLMSTGLFVAFTTDAVSIALNYSLTEGASLVWNMPESGTAGADLFRFDEASQTWGYVRCLNKFPHQPGAPLVATMSQNLPKLDRPSRYLLYFPLRKTVQAASIAVGAAFSLPVRDPAFSSDSVTFNGLKPIVWYGTSIDQGGVVSRPGNTFTNHLTRNLGRSVLNMGFAGNCKMELEVAEFLTELDPAAFVIDCLWSMDSSLIANNTAPFVKYIRERHPETPIVLAAGTRAGKYWFDPVYNDESNEALFAEYDKLVAAGVKNLHLVRNDNDELYGSDTMTNPTVDGMHPTDLGHWEMVNFYTQYFRDLFPTASALVV